MVSITKLVNFGIDLRYPWGGGILAEKVSLGRRYPWGGGILEEEVALGRWYPWGGGILGKEVALRRRYLWGGGILGEYVSLGSTYPWEEVSMGSTYPWGYQNQQIPGLHEYLDVCGTHTALWVPGSQAGRKADQGTKLVFGSSHA
jgi:hypothetical protein